MENYYKSSPKKKTDFLKKPVCQQSEAFIGKLFIYLIKIKEHISMLFHF